MKIALDAFASLDLYSKNIVFRFVCSMHRPLSSAQAHQRIENRRKYSELQKEREEMRKVRERYLPQRSKDVSVPERPVSHAVEKPKGSIAKKREPVAKQIIPQCNAFEVTCGGSIFWIVSNETVEISDGVGNVLHTLEISHGTVIEQTDAHMWLGTRDGTVHVFDKYSAAHLLTHKGHKNAVRCFAKGIDDAVYSGSEDGTIAEWGDSSGDVKFILTQVVLQSPVLYMVCYGFRLFVAQVDGSLTEYEAETSEIIKRFETNGKLIVALVCVNGYVCTVHADGKALIWNMADGKLRRTLQNADSDDFTAALADGWNQQLLLASAKNSISFFDMNDGGKFRCIREVCDLGKGHVASLKGIPKVRHLEVMLLCSDGVNFIFDLQTDLVCQELRFAVNHVEKRFEQIKLETTEAKRAIEEYDHKINGIMSTRSIRLKERVVASQVEGIFSHLCEQVVKRKRTQKLLSRSENLKRAVCRLKVIFFLRELLRNSRNRQKIMLMKSKLVSATVRFRYAMLSEQYMAWRMSVV